MVLAAIILQNKEYLDAAYLDLRRRREGSMPITPRPTSARQATHWPMAVDRTDRKDERLPLLIAPEQLLF